MLGLLTALALTAAAAGADGGPPEGPTLTTVVTGSRSERRLEDTVVATEVIRREDIAASGAQNAAEALASHVGVELAPSLTTAGQTVRLQGLDSQYVLVLIDGEPAVGRVAGGIDLARISAEQIDHVEIVKGPSSALYGSDAIAGVVNIITRRPLRPRGAGAHLQGGSRAAVDAAARAEAEQERWRGTFNAGFHRADPYDLDPSTTQTSGPGYSEADFSARADLPAGAHTFTPRAEYLIRDQRGVDASPSKALLNRRNLTETFDGSLRDAWAGGGAWKASGRADYSLFRDQFLLDQRGSKALDQYQETREQLGLLTGQAELALGPHQAVAGAEGRLEHLASGRLAGGTGQRERAALFFSDDWRLLERPRLLLSPGARLEADTQFGLYPAPKLAARFDPLPELAVRASYGWGYRAPSFKELLLHFENPGVGYVVDGNPDLRPERSQGVTLGVEVQPTERVWLSVEGYWNALQDLITTASEPVSPGSPLQFRYVNVAEARTRGVELATRFRPASPLTIEAGYALTDARSLPDERLLEGRAQHRWTFQTTWRPRSWGLEATLRGSVTGPRRFYHLADGTELTATHVTPPYALLEARVSKELWRWLSVFVGGTNLLGAGDPTFLPLPPRAFYAGLDLRTPD